MTEQGWLSSTDPEAMLRLVWENPDHANITCIRSARKMRLFACACARQVWDRLTDERSRRAVELAEMYADGEATEEEQKRARILAYEPWNTGLAWIRGLPLSATAVTIGAGQLLQRATRGGIPPATQADLLRCIFNPFRPVTLDPAVLTPEVIALARAAYEETGGQVCGRCGGKRRHLEMDEDREGTPRPRMVDCSGCHGTGRVGVGMLDPERLRVLADALEEAGLPAEVECPECQGTGWLEFSFKGGPLDVSPQIKYVMEPPKQCMCLRCEGARRIPNPILTHLRGPGPHCRGCWVVDLVLGKE